MMKKEHRLTISGSSWITEKGAIPVMLDRIAANVCINGHPEYHVSIFVDVVCPGIV
jgi:hypothetical protein